jgi:hypothetical protein
VYLRQRLCRVFDAYREGKPLPKVPATAAALPDFQAEFSGDLARAAQMGEIT